jgi:hypothetical protein
MPQIFRYLKFIFSFLSNEHLPPHVHVSDEMQDLDKQFYPTPKKQAKKLQNQNSNELNKDYQAYQCYMDRRLQNRIAV